MLESLSDDDLWSQTKSVFADERRVSVRTIRHLREIQRRKLEIDRGYGGLLEPCMEEFGLSQTATFQRIACLNMMTEIIEIEAMIESADLTMSVVAMVRRFFRREENSGRQWSYDQKLALLNRLRGLSCPKAKALLVSLNEEFTDADGVDRVSDAMVRLRIHMKVSDHKDVERLKHLYSHTHPGISEGDLFVLLVKKELEKKDPARGTQSPKDDAAVLPMTEVKLTRAVRQAVWQNATLGCAWISPLTGRRCGSLHMLEIDHIVERALGGTNDLSNLRLCCDKHNRRRAEVKFGKFQKGKSKKA
jgi:hypothetical protein